MAWTAPTTRSTGDLITASIWNTDLKDNLDYLKTREMFFDAEPKDGTYGDFTIVRLPTSGANAFMNFFIPDDFLSLTEAVVIVIPRATQGTANWDIYSDYAASGESYNTHDESDAALTYNVTNNQLFEVNVSGILSSIAAGDYGGIRLTLSDSLHDLDVIGLRIKYA